MSVAVEPEAFHYVVERKPPAPICFGSKLERSTGLIGKGLSPFQRRLAFEVNPVTGPGYYAAEKCNGAIDKLLSKVRSNRGVGPLASRDPRFKDKTFMRVPSPTRYSAFIALPMRTQGHAPFGTLTKRMVTKHRQIPGPATYDLTRVKKCRKTRVMCNWGQPEMIPSIEINCVSIPKDTCLKCEQICSEGDYWQKDHWVFLCHLCWEDERRTRELYSKKELSTFQKIRNCSFTHRHEGTTAAMYLLEPRKVRKKLRLENYLDLFIKC